MRRRDFIGRLGAALAAVPWFCPGAARAQQGGGMRRIGVLMPFTAGDAEGNARSAVFEQRLQQLGWTVGQNVQLDYRMAGGGADPIRRSAAELVALAPDVIVSSAA